MSPLVFVIVLNYNTPWNLLSRCLTSLSRTIYPNWRIVLVDNASTDDSMTRVQLHFPEIEILQNRCNVGYPGGNNRGIHYALANGARYCVLLNPDIAVVDPYWLEELVGLAGSEEQIGLIGCEELKDSANIMWISELLCKHEHVPSMWDAPKASGAAMLLNVDMVNATGLFDETYFAYTEEDDLAHRAKQAGFAVKASNIQVFHEHHGCWGRHRLRASYLSMRNMMRFAIKHYSLIRIFREIMRTLYLACGPTVAKRATTEVVVRRIRYSKNVLINFGIFVVALLWNLTFLPNTLRRHYSEQELIRAYLQQQEAGQAPHGIR